MMPPPRCPKPSPGRFTLCGLLCPRTPARNTRRYEHLLTGGPGPIGVGLCTLCRWTSLQDALL